MDLALVYNTLLLERKKTFIFYRKRQKDIEAKDSHKSDHPIVFEAFNRFIKVIRCVGLHKVFA